MYKKRTSKGAFHHNCVAGDAKQPNDVTADDKTRKPMVFAAELTGVNEQRKPEAEAVLSRPSSHLFVVSDGNACTEKIAVAINIIDTVNRWPELV